MVFLVIVTPKNVGFGYYVGHKFINQKKKPRRKQKNKETKKTNPLEATLPWAQLFSQDFVFFGFFVSPVADESFRV